MRLRLLARRVRPAACSPAAARVATTRSGGAPRRTPLAASAPAAVPGDPDADSDATATPSPAAPDGELAIGLTEQNPNFIWPAGANDVAPAFAPLARRAGRAQAVLLPAHPRLARWSPSAASPSSTASTRAACAEPAVRVRIGGCGTSSGARRAPARGRLGDARRTERDARVGRAAGGRLRARQTQPRSRPARATWRSTGASSGAVLAEARRRRGTALLEPMERAEPPVLRLARSGGCATGAPRSAAVAPYVAMARALRLALDAAPGDQQLVLGELAGLDKRRPMTTSVAEFVSRHPGRHGLWLADLDAARLRRRERPGRRPRARAGAQGLTGRSDLDHARPASARHAAARSGGRRRRAQIRACGRLHRRLKRWYRRRAA